MLLKKSGLILKKIPYVNKWASQQVHDFGAPFFAIFFLKSIVDDLEILHATGQVNFFVGLLEVTKTT